MRAAAILRSVSRSHQVYRHHIAPTCARQLFPRLFSSDATAEPTTYELAMRTRARERKEWDYDRRAHHHSPVSATNPNADKEKELKREQTKSYTKAKREPPAAYSWLDAQEGRSEKLLTQKEFQRAQTKSHRKAKQLRLLAAPVAGATICNTVTNILAPATSAPPGSLEFYSAIAAYALVPFVFTRHGLFGTSMLPAKYGRPWDGELMTYKVYKSNHQERERERERNKAGTTWYDRLMLLVMGVIFRLTLGGILSSAIKGLAVRLAAVPALKALSGFLVLFAGLINDNSDVDKVGAPAELNKTTKLPTSHVQTENTIPIPTSWSNRCMGVNSVDSHYKGVVDITGHPIMFAIQKALQENGHPVCKGRDGTSMIKNCKIVKLDRIENVPLWKAYWRRKNEMIDTYHAHNVRIKPLQPPATKLYKKIPAAKIPGPPVSDHSPGWWHRQSVAIQSSPVSVSQWPERWDQYMDKNKLLDDTLNEVFLYHGTKHDIVEIIGRHGFDERVASLDGLYGAGTYFAEQSCKALQYSPAKTETWIDSVTGKQVTKTTKIVLIARVTLGDPFYAKKENNKNHNQRRRPPDRETQQGLLYDSMVANATSGQVHREIMVYDRSQAYPEYMIGKRVGSIRTGKYR